jgi:DNA-binding beta-propeller fold protein YncE
MREAVMRCGVLGVLSLILFVAVIPNAVTNVAAGQARTIGEVPTFQLEPSWPKKLPNDWIFGPVSGLTVDSQDHVWVITRPHEVMNAAQKTGHTAPPVIEFDQQGNFVQGWGGPGDGYEWPVTEHGITVDSKGFVWIAGRGNKDHQILKFTKAGKFVLQIGRSGASKGNADTTNFNMPADVTVYDKTNEIFVADGYGNRRVIVFDTNTGAFKRMWGAFGNVPQDPKPAELLYSPDDMQGPGPQQFNNVHSVRISNDGLVYVCDRENQRVQVFTLDGKYLTQVFISRGTLPESTASGTLFGRPRKQVEDGVLRSHESPSRTTFSPDAQQRFLYVLDRRQQKIAILERKTLNIVGYFGGGIGEGPGQFYIMHDMATDSHGNFYTAEINQNSRVQKFAFKGMKKTGE